MEGLTARQRDALAALRAHFAEHGRPPSLKEIGGRLGVTTSTANGLIKHLVRAGVVEVAKRPGVKTQIRLIDPLGSFATHDLEATLAARRANDTETMPLTRAA